jgi:Flp pilus assembly protein protease CpaA
MLRYLVPVTALAISAIDIKHHRIPNQLTILLAILLLCDSHIAAIQSLIPAIVITVILGTLGRFGAGDVKLFIALILTSSPLVLNSRYFLGMATVSFISVLLSLLFCGPRAKMIAFAPAILLPFAAIYLAI